MLAVVRCVKKDYGAIGCAVDVLSFADSRCSARSRCTITVADFSLRGIRPCPQDLTSYFEAAYRCVPGKWKVHTWKRQTCIKYWRSINKCKYFRCRYKYTVLKIGT